MAQKMTMSPDWKPEERKALAGLIRSEYRRNTEWQLAQRMAGGKYPYSTEYTAMYGHNTVLLRRLYELTVADSTYLEAYRARFRNFIECGQRTPSA